MKTTDRPVWMHWAVALALLVLGGYPFVTGEFQARSVLWNSAAFVLLLVGALRVWMLWRGIPEARLPSRLRNR